MGEWDDLAKALNGFVKWADDFFEEERKREVEEVEEEPIVELPKFAPVADFFNMVEEVIENPPESWKKFIDLPVYKPSPEVMAGYVPKYAEEVEEEVAEEDELWYKYFTTLDSGYWGTEFYDEVEQVYYSEESGREWQAEDRIVEDYGERYFGKDNEVLGSSDRGEAVPYSEVNLDRIL